MKRTTALILLLIVIAALARATTKACLPEADELTRRVVLLYGQGRATKAVPLARKAVAIRRQVLGPSHFLVATSFNNLGAVLNEAGDYAAARAAYEQALAIHKQLWGPNDENVAITLNNLANLFLVTRDFSAARQHVEEALAIRMDLFGERDNRVAESLNSLGYLYEALGDDEAAKLHYEKALAIRRQTVGDKHPDTALSLHNLGMLLESMGDYSQARICYEEALTIRKEALGENHLAVASTLNALGSVIATFGDWEAARDYYADALAIRANVLGENHPLVANTLSNAGLLFVDMRDYARARRCLEAALSIRTKIFGDDHLDVAVSYDNLGALHRAEQDFAAARDSFERLLEIRKKLLGPDHPDTAFALNNVGFACQGLHEYDEAMRHYAGALAIQEKSLHPTHPELMATLGNIATLHAALGDWPEALGTIDRERRIARVHVTRVLPGLSASEQLTYLYKDYSSAFNIALGAGWLRRDDPAACELSAGWLINGKAVALESLAQNALVARARDDVNSTKAVEKLLAIRRELASLAISTPAGNQADAYRERFDELERQEADLSRRLAFAGHNVAADDRWVDIAKVRQSIPDDAIYIDIAQIVEIDFNALADDKPRPMRYVAWVVPPADQGDIAIVDLGSSKAIQNAVSEARRRLASFSDSEARAVQALKEPLKQLADLTLEPLKNAIGDRKRLILCPDQALWQVPWAALPVAEGRYAVEDFQIDYVVSGRDLIANSTTAAPREQPIILADPDYNLKPAAAVPAPMDNPNEDEAAAPESRAAFDRSLRVARVSRLPGAAREAEAIAPSLERFAGKPPKVLTDDRALEGAFKAAKSPAVVVLSTHGFFVPQFEDGEFELTRPSSSILPSNPLLRCGLLLSGCNWRFLAGPGQEDGVLTGMEIIGTDLRGTELAVLSACETGVGDIHAADGVWGLRQAFQIAGARAVVATLWQIPDEDTADLMADFFANLAEGQDKGLALRNAQISRIEARREKYGAAHPLFWAAFTVTGL